MMNEFSSNEVNEADISETTDKGTENPDNNVDEEFSHELDASYDAYMEDVEEKKDGADVNVNEFEDENEIDDLDSDLNNTYNFYMEERELTAYKKDVSAKEMAEEDFGGHLDSDGGDKYNECVDKGQKYDEILSNNELPECFDNLSEAVKASQLDVLNRMSDEEREAYYGIIEKEPAITVDVQAVAEKNNGELQGLEYRVKAPSSTYEKMHERGEEIDIGEMKDVIRYTEIYSPDKLAEGTNGSLQDFESRGYTVERVKNTWDDENTAYRGINANLISPDGQIFEVQFHTQESFDLKNGELHSLYEERRTMADDDPHAVELDDKMTELSSKLERPENIDEVKSR